MAIADSKKLGSKMYGNAMGYIYGEVIAALELLEADMNALEAEMLARVTAQEDGAKGGRPSAKPSAEQIKQQLLELRKERTAKNARVRLVKDLSAAHAVKPSTAREWVRDALSVKQNG